MNQRVFRLLHQGCTVAKDYETLSLDVYSYRILLSIDSTELSLESLPDISTKSNYLRRLLTEKKVGDVLCLKFKLVISYYTDGSSQVLLHKCTKNCKTEPTHTTSKDKNPAVHPQLYQLLSEK